MTMLKISNALTKSAAPIDAVGDSEYESAFSNIAHSLLRRKAPALVPFEVGFQLLDRAEDDSKAVGALLYAVGESMLIVPLVFVNGELKGADSIYLQDDNLYLPLSEEWVKAVIAHHQQPLGRNISRDRASQGYTSPDLQRAYGLRPKYAKLLADWYRGARDTLLETKTAGLKNLGLVEFLTKHASLGQISAFTSALRSDPLLAAWYRDNYGLETLKTAAAQAVFRREGCELLDSFKQAAAEPETQYIKYAGVMPAGLTPEQQTTLAKQGWLILDKRADDAQATMIKTPGVLKNPTASGVYEVLRVDGKFTKALVLCRPITRGMQGNGLVRDGEMITVVALDGERNYVNAHHMSVWVREHDPDREEGGLQALPSLDGLSVATGDRGGSCDARNMGSEGISSREPLRPLEMDETGEPDCESCDCSEPPVRDLRNSSFVFFSPDLQDATSVFWGVREAQGTGGTTFTGTVADFLDSKNLSPSEIQSRQLLHKQTNMLEGVVVSDVEDSRPIYTAGFLRLPANWKALRLGTGTLHLGNPQTFAKVNTKSAAAVVVSGDRHGFVVDNQRYNDRGAAAWRLVDGFGLSVKDACELLTAAEKSLQTAYVKAAAPSFPDLMQFMGQSQSPYSGGFGGPQMEAGTQAVMDQQQEPTREPDYRFIRDTMQTGAETGIQEVTELGGLVSLLQTSSEDRIIDDKLPKLTRAVDSIAQLLLHLYIHTDVFVTRYGKADTKELEAGLKNTLEALGKTLYHLKHRTVSSQPEATLVDQDLRDATD